MLSRFVLVGALCVIINMALFEVLTNRAGISYLMVTCIAFATVNALGFWLNRSFTFRATHGAALGQASRFYLVQTLSLALNLALMYALVDLARVDAVMASVVVSALFALGSFLAHRGWTFARQPRT